MILTTKYEILVDGNVVKFSTNLTERDFYHTLDAVYGEGNYQTLVVSKEW